MKRLLQSGLFALCFFVTPFVASAATEMPTADSGTITLTEETTISDYVVAQDDTVTLDLNGQTLNVNNYMEVNGTLTIQDSGSNGTINLTNRIAVDGGTLTLNSGNIINNYGYGTGAFYGGKIIVNGGTITSLHAPLSGNNTEGAMIFEVNGGTLTAKEGPAIYMPGPISLTMTGGTLNGGISLRMGDVTISGGTINATTGSIDTIEEYYGYSGDVWLADALFIMGGTYTSNVEGYTNALNLTITGGTFNCTNGQGSAVAYYDLGKIAQTANINISGGTFNTNASDRSAFEVVKFSDLGVTNASYGVTYATLQTNITGGTFSTSPSEYLNTSYVAYAVNSAYVVTANTAQVDTDETVVGVVGDEETTTNYEVTIEETTTTVDSQTQTAIENAVSSIKNVTITDYFDITVLENNEEVTITDEPIQFKVQLSDELLAIPSGYQRTYYVIRYHDGKAEIIATITDAENGYITFETDKFSTYAIAYSDELLTSNVVTTNADGSTTTATTTSIENPKTADNISLYIIVLTISLLGMISLLKKPVKVTNN